jgi:hypothetical protein
MSYTVRLFSCKRTMIRSPVSRCPHPRTEGAGKIFAAKCWQFSLECIVGSLANAAPHNPRSESGKGAEGARRPCGNTRLLLGKSARLGSSLSWRRLRPAYDVLHLRGEINVMMHHLPAPCFSAIDIRDAILELHLLTAEGCLGAFRTDRVG